MNVCLGNDGFSNNMWADWKAAYLLHKVASRDPRRRTGRTWRSGGREQRAAGGVSSFPARRLGQLIEGARADMILVDYHPFTPLTVGNLPWHILFGFEASMVTTTMVDGKI